MRKILSLFAAALTCPPAYAEPQDAPAERCEGGTAAHCQYLLQATRAFTAMLVTGDPAPLERHRHPRAVWISATGDVQPIDRLSELIRADTPRATARLDRADVRFFGPTAIVSWSETWTAPGAKVAAGRLSGVDSWSLISGRWRLVATVEHRQL